MQLNGSITCRMQKIIFDTASNFMFCMGDSSSLHLYCGWSKYCDCTPFLCEYCVHSSHLVMASYFLPIYRLSAIFLAVIFLSVPSVLFSVFSVPLAMQ